LWLRTLFSELRITVSSPILLCDNLRATFLASNSAFHARTKYIEIDYHFVREKVADGRIIICFICSQDQITDALTKSLSTTCFQFLRSKLTVVCSPLSLRGCVSDIQDMMTHEEMEADITHKITG
jgi:hypothetical protein